MKVFISFCCVFFFVANAFCQQWTQEQLQKANTFFDEYRQNDIEKAVIQYINLCRLYPAEFAVYELVNYTGLPGVEDKNFADYKNSLAKELATMVACSPLQPDDLLYDDARCYSDELSKNKRTPHERINCAKRNYGECIYYGSGEAKHIAMQWLIDSGIQSLAHRKMCLLPACRKAGIKLNTHFEYKFCTVLELSK